VQRVSGALEKLGGRVVRVAVGSRSYRKDFRQVLPAHAARGNFLGAFSQQAIASASRYFYGKLIQGFFDFQMVQIGKPGKITHRPFSFAKAGTSY